MLTKCDNSAPGNPPCPIDTMRYRCSCDLLPKHTGPHHCNCGLSWGDTIVISKALTSYTILMLNDTPIGIYSSEELAREQLEAHFQSYYLEAARGRLNYHLRTITLNAEAKL